MTQREEDEIFGRMRRDLIKAKERKKALDYEGKRIANLFYEMGHAFDPESATPMRPLLNNEHFRLLAKKDEALAILRDIQHTELTISKLEKDLSS